MTGTNETSSTGGGWKARLVKGLRAVKRVLRLPLRLDHYVEGAEPARIAFAEQQRQYQALRGANTALERLVAELLPRLQQDVRAGREDVGRLADVALPELRSAAAESREEVRRLKHRYAEYYGALVEQMREQNRRLDRLTERQEQLFRLLTPPDVLPLDREPSQLPQAG